MSIDSKSRMQGIALLAITSIGWGLNWPVIKLILAAWPPLFSRGVAGIIGASVLAVICLARRESLRVPLNELPALSAAAFTNVFSWMGFTTIAMKTLSVAEASLLVYTMPIWVALLSWPLLGAKPSWQSAIALLLGSAGIVTLFSNQGINLSADKLTGIALTLSAAIFFALGSILNRKKFSVGPYALVTWQVGLACVPMAILGLLFEQPSISALHGYGWLSLAYMALIPMALCYVTWFGALRLLPPTTAAIGTLAVPVIGVISAALILREALGVREAAAVALTITGVWLALWRPVKS